MSNPESTNVHIEIKDSFELVIIGGGAGGLYSAYRLLNDTNKINTGQFHLFEATENLGGRIRTLPMEDLPLTADIGAMRYIPKRQLIINSFVKKFSLRDEKHEVPVLSYYLRTRTILPKTPLREKVKMRKTVTSTEGIKSLEISEQDAFALTEIENFFHPSELVVFAILKAFSSIQLDRSQCPRELLLWFPETVRKITDIEILFKSKIDNETTEDRVTRIRSYMQSKFNFDYFSYNEWQIVKNAAKYNHEYLYTTSLFNILQRELSHEAVVLSEDALGYNTIFAAANAAEHIPWFLNDFHVQSYHTIKNGMFEIIKKLKEQIDNFIGQKEWHSFNHKLISITTSPDEDKYILKFLVNQNIIYYKTQKIIFAISKGALERIYFPIEFKLNVTLEQTTKNGLFSEAIQCVTPYPLLKAFAFYNKNWFWDSLPEITKSLLLFKNEQWGYMNVIGNNFIATRIITDLPIRQIYLHANVAGSIWSRNLHTINSSQHDGTKSMVMVYGDSKKAELWASLAGKTDKDSCHIGPDFQGLYYKGLDSAIESHSASQAFVDMLTRNLELAFEPYLPLEALESCRHPTAVFMQDWNKSPFYGGWHAWCINNKPWELRKAILRPFQEENIFICGEPFSADQGWIEGAFRTVEAMLINHFSLAKPDWIKDEEYISHTSLCQNENSISKDKFIDYINW